MQDVVVDVNVNVHVNLNGSSFFVHDRVYVHVHDHVHRTKKGPWWISTTTSTPSTLCHAGAR